VLSYITFGRECKEIVGKEKAEAIADPYLSYRNVLIAL
jgi:hypothetical protein